MHASELDPAYPRASTATDVGDVVAKARTDIAEAKRLMAELITARPATPAYTIENGAPRRDA
jgi:hypothetical protein